MQRYGKLLIEICVSLKDANAEVEERVVAIRNHWKRISMQVDYVRRIWKALDDELQAIQSQTLQVLSRKLSDTYAKLDRIYKKKSGQIVGVRRWKYALYKQCLDRAIEDLILWQDRYNPSWFLMLRISNPVIDKELGGRGLEPSLLPVAKSLRDLQRNEPSNRSSVFLPKDGLDFAQRHAIRFSTTELIKRSKSEKWVVVDHIQCNQRCDLTLTTKNMRELATMLSATNPMSFCILKCRGVIRNIEPSSGKPSSFDFIFDVPKELSGKPETLRSYICSCIQPTLNERFLLAYQLAKSVSYVHTLGFVHKNIRPETFLGWSTGTQSFASVFLVGFEKLRSADGRTIKMGDSSWERNIYRHPQRQGLHPEEIYVMQHDIYSLGVCLLEIGIWQSFLLYNDADDPKASESLQSAFDRTSNNPFMLKNFLVALAQEKLPRQMGKRYTEVAVNCLTCMDEDNTDFGDKAQFEDDDGILVGARYIAKVSAFKSWLPRERH